jgi:hypothetical protein
VNSHVARVGLAEVEVVPEFGVFRLYASGYGRDSIPIATFDSAVAASVFLALLRSGASDVRRVPATPLDEAEVFLAGPIEAILLA